jgi:hypothetical protein
MRPVNRARVLLIALAAPTMLSAEESAGVAMLRCADGPAIEIFDPAGNALGKAVSPCWSLALADGGPAVTAFSENQALVVWYGALGAAVSILEASGGTLREVCTDAFEPGWTIYPARDFNRDGLPDFLVVKTAGEGDDRSYDCAVAVWDRAAGIDLVTDPVTIIPRCRGAYFTTGDVDGDGAADLVFHKFDYGGSYETELYMLKGRGDGTLDPQNRKKLLLTSPYAASNPVLEDFDGDGDLDVFLPPDDDVDDEGQCHIAFNTGDGTMEKLRDSLDLAPDRESGSADAFFATASIADVDGDGKGDLVAANYVIPDLAWAFVVHRGKGAGEFDPQGRVLASGVTGKDTAPALAWIRWPGAAAQPPPAQPPARKDLEAWWAALGSKKPREAARAMGAFLRAGGAAVPFLAEQIPAGAPLDKERVQTLIHELDDDRFESREQASEKLKAIADVAEALLRTALENPASPEVAVRLKEILEARPAELVAQLPAESHSLARLLALLDAIDTPESVEAVGRLVQPNVPRAIRRAAGDAVRRNRR